MPHVVRRAERLIFSGENTRACRLLAHALADIDPITARPDARLIEAAICYAETLSFEWDIPDRAELQLTWVRYAETAALTCYGRSSQLWQRAAGFYARVCATQGLTFDAVAVLQRTLAAYRTYGPPDRIPEVRGQLAAALHDDGQCAEARTEIHDAWHTWLRTRARIRARSPHVGGQLLTTYASILAGCGQTSDARALLRDHADLVTAEANTSREAAALVAAVQIAMTERDHRPVCTARPAPAVQAPTSTPLPSQRWQVWETLLLKSHPTPSTPLDQRLYRRGSPLPDWS
ncbi:hypothetical protein [Nucisporomicrobium flavum]|uniref:hypothetical protein n=1 Tax=Nucisporomicrobium flavum TaxID=2785915 RepID=UPI0018F51609|nr:hypothetical protein [Nucisporomicrobium flavum]